MGRYRHTMWHTGGVNDAANYDGVRLRVEKSEISQVPWGTWLGNSCYFFRDGKEMAEKTSVQPNAERLQGHNVTQQFVPDTSSSGQKSSVADSSTVMHSDDRRSVMMMTLNENNQPVLGTFLDDREAVCPVSVLPSSGWPDLPWLLNEPRNHYCLRQSASPPPSEPTLDQHQLHIWHGYHYPAKTNSPNFSRKRSNFFV